MEKIKINFKKSNNKIDSIVGYLKRGKVIVYPTDTIYGFGCMANNKRAIEKIYKIKKRKEGKPLLVLVSSIRMAEKYCFVNKEQKDILKKMWNSGNVSRLPHRPPTLSRRAPRNDIYIRPITFILKAKGKLPKELTSGQDGLAVRLPKNDFLIKIIRKIRVPLVSTSVNVSGEKSLVSVDEKERGQNFSKNNPPYPPVCNASVRAGRPLSRGLLPDLVIDAGKLNGKASAIVDLMDINNIKILRK